MPPLIKRLCAEQRLQVVEVFRDGPRYWVGHVSQAGRPAILKAVISDTPWQRPDTGAVFRPSDQLRTETLMMASLGHYAYELPGAVPELIASGLEDEVWMLRGLTPGHDMAGGVSPFVYRPEFYQTEVAEALIHYIGAYQRLTARAAEVLRRSPQTQQASLAAKMLDNDLDRPTELVEDYAPAIKCFLVERRDLYDTHRAVLAHGQAFPPHIYWDGHQVSLIDWENAGLSNSLHDYVAVWMRGFDDPAWQAGFVNRLRAHGPLATEVDEELWQMEVLIQATGNLNYLYWSRFETAAKKTQAVASLRRQIKDILARV